MWRQCGGSEQREMTQLPAEEQAFGGEISVRMLLSSGHRGGSARPPAFPASWSRGRGRDSGQARVPDPRVGILALVPLSRGPGPRDTLSEPGWPETSSWALCAQQPCLRREPGTAPGAEQTDSKRPSSQPQPLCRGPAAPRRPHSILTLPRTSSRFTDEEAEAQSREVT